MAQLTEPTPVLTVTYYGHCAFLWETAQGARVLVDPYRNREDRYWFTREFPQVPCDLGLITHAHFDHDAAGRLPESASLLRMPGELRYRDLYVRGIGDLHSNPRGTLPDFPNVMFRLEAGGLRFLHIGDNRADWPAEVAESVGQVDVLMVTVDDSNHLLTYEEVDSLIDRLSPRVVIPMHYQIPGLMPDCAGLRPPDGWLATQQRVKRLGRHSTTFSGQDLPDSTEIWVFEPSPESMSAPEAVP
ncbi:MAG: MBL fold metallo-hydrolase [Chloroflexi bacterium]|nr:MBL fold metallo-hydrolase [Chloroflexota bacterium]